MNKRISLGLAVSLMAIAAALTFIFTMAFSTRRFNEKVSNADRLAAQYPHLEELDQTVRKYFYADVNEDSLTDGILKGYVSGLGDRYSNYMSAQGYTENQDQTAGVYTGIGITVTQSEHNEISVVEVAEDGPADKAGIVPNDCIVMVDDLRVADDYNAASSAIAGEAGTYVKLQIRGAGSDVLRTISVKRAVIDEKTVTYKMLENHIGYIRITKFRSVSVSQFENALSDLQGKGAVGFIFDVRNNGGGLLSALEQMADPLLPEGEIAYATYKDGHRDVILKSDAKMLDMPYVILVNENTASASELFACALRDYAGAVLVGEKTFGKGIMQTTFPLSDGSGVTLTVATYETGKTPCYHEIGLAPDVPSVLDTETEDDSQLADAIKTMNSLLSEHEN